MGSNFCCDARIVKQVQVQDAQTSQLLINNFMHANPSIQEVCNRPGEIYGHVEKNSIVQYDIGTYIGRFTNKKKNGLGLMLFHDHMYYEGEWANDHIEGRGKFIFTNGDFYDGEWKNSLPDGQGLYVSRNPIWRYDGHWENGQQNGKGKQIFEDSSFYEGDFLKGLRHGKGKFRNHDGRFYEGSFLNGEINGTAEACDERFAYEGEWKDGKIDGAGKSEWFSKDKKLEVEYIGEYKDGVKHGFGEYRQRDGVTFKGNWENGNITKSGVIIKSDTKKGN